MTSEKLKYFVYTPLLIFLDYVVSIVLVMIINKDVDVCPADFRPLSEADRVLQNDSRLTKPWERAEI